MDFLYFHRAMEPLQLEGNFEMPTVSCNAQEGKIEIKGRSIPPHPLDFYQQIFDWWEKYTQEKPSQTEIEISLEYFNTASFKYIMHLLRLANEFHTSGNGEVKLNWYYEEDDEDLMETGELIQETFAMPVEIIEVPEEE